MQFVPSGVSLSFEVTYDSPTLFVGMSVYDDSGLTPILIQGPSAMLNVVGNTYRGKFTADPGKSYIVHKAVYTSGSFTTIDSGYSQGSESIKSAMISSSSAFEIIGLVQETEEIKGIVQNNDQLLGFVSP